MDARQCTHASTEPAPLSGVPPADSRPGSPCAWAVMAAFTVCLRRSQEKLGAECHSGVSGAGVGAHLTGSGLSAYGLSSGERGAGTATAGSAKAPGPGHTVIKPAVLFLVSAVCLSFASFHTCGCVFTLCPSVSFLLYLWLQCLIVMSLPLCISPSVN